MTADLIEKSGMLAAYGLPADPVNGYRQSFYLTAGQFAIDMIVIESIVPPLLSVTDVRVICVLFFELFIVFHTTIAAAASTGDLGLYAVE